MLEMVIDSIRVSLANYQRVVILRVKDSDRYLPIWIRNGDVNGFFGEFSCWGRRLQSA